MLDPPPCELICPMATQMFAGIQGSKVNDESNSKLNNGKHFGDAPLGYRASRGASDGKCVDARARIGTGDAVAHRTTDGRNADANGPRWSKVSHTVRVWPAQLAYFEPFLDTCV